MYRLITLAQAILLSRDIFVTVWTEAGVGEEVKISKKTARRVMKQFLKVKVREDEGEWENSEGSIVAFYNADRNSLVLGR